MSTSLLLRIVCATEAATGFALLVSPSTVVPLLIGSEIIGAGIATTRIGGIALMALGFACWADGNTRALQAMAGYSLLVAAYMAAVSLAGGQTGVLWWPAFGSHLVLGALLARALFKK